MPAKSRAAWNEKKKKTAFVTGRQQWNLISHFTFQPNMYWAFSKCWSLMSGMGNGSENWTVPVFVDYLPILSNTLLTRVPGWGSSKSFWYFGSHTSTISFSPKRKGNKPTFSQLWILTVELRYRIIFVWKIIFARRSFSFKFKYLQLAILLLYAQTHLKGMLSKVILVLCFIFENIFEIRKFVSKVMQNKFSLPPHSHTHPTILVTYSQ